MLGVGHARVSSVKGPWVIVNNALFCGHPHLMYTLSLLPCEQGLASAASAIPLWAIYLLTGLEQFQPRLIASQAVAVLLQGPQPVVTVSSDAGQITL